MNASTTEQRARHVVQKTRELLTIGGDFNDDLVVFDMATGSLSIKLPTRPTDRDLAGVLRGIVAAFAVRRSGLAFRTP